MFRIVLAVVFCAFGSLAGELTLRGSRGVTNVWMGDAQLTHFKNPHYIYNKSISPSGKYALVWHMDFTPTKIMTIDLSNRKILADFAPGFGGEIQWTAEDRIVMIGGCGTGCQIAAVFDIFGKRTFGPEDSLRVDGEFRDTSMVEMHPTRQALVFMSSIPAVGSILLLRTADNSVSRIAVTNVACLDWKAKGNALEVIVSTNRNNFEPTGKVLIRLPKEWEAPHR